MITHGNSQGNDPGHRQGIVPDRERALGLDLLRALAIGAVLVSHFGDGFTSFYGARQPETLSHGGFYGVELFFVLSGFLIGRILLDLAARDRSLRAWVVFMCRRWLRTLPLYYLWLAILVCLAPPTGRFAWHVLHYASFSQNLAWPMPADNWFGVSWTLAVEEWFYLLFSITLFLLLRARHEIAQAWPAILLFLLAPLAARLLWVAPSDWTGNEAVVFRLDGIAYGVVVAALLRGRTIGAGLAGWTLLAGVALLLAAAFVFEPWIAEPPLPTPPWVMLGFFVASCGGFALCLPAAARFRGWSGWLPKLIQLIARLSYALYLVHLSVLEICAGYVWRGMLSPPAAILLTVTATGVLAWVLNRYVEAPIIARRPSQYPTQANPPARAAAVTQA